MNAAEQFFYDPYIRVVVTELAAEWIPDIPTRYICKSCGAQSPAGIGYAAQGQVEFPEPAPGCENLHEIA